MQDVYDNMTKSMLIGTYKKWLDDKKQFNSNKRRGKYKLPKINGEWYSWNQFKRLPRDAILVIIVTEGCDVEYMTELNNNDFYTEKREWHENYGLNPFNKEEEK